MTSALSTAQAFILEAVAKLPPPAQSLLASPTTRNLAILFSAYTAARQFNRILSSFVLNNWSSDKYDWPREIVLVTGGSAGIGKSVAYDLAGRGVKVIIADVQEPTESLPPNVYYYKCDVTSTASVKSLGAQVRKDHGDPSVLINNAGIGKEGPILAKSEALVRKVFEVNTISHWWTVQEFLPSMLKKNHGHIITIASAASFLGLGEMTDYSASKASALAFHEGLTQEIRLWYKAPKVRTSIVHPLWVRTALIQPITDSGVKMRQGVMEVEDVSRVIVKHVLSGNSGQLIIPNRISNAGLLRALPNWLQEQIRNFVSDDLRKIRIAKDAQDAAAAAAAAAK